MKKFLALVALCAIGIGIMACNSASYATVKIYNDDDLPVPFNLSYSSNVVDTSGIESYAPREYEIEVYPRGDHVVASVWKTSVDNNEIKIELYYKGKLQDMEKTSAILIPAIVTFDID